MYLKDNYYCRILNVKDKYLFEAKKPNQYFPYEPIIALRKTSGCHHYKKMGEDDSTTNVGNYRLHLFYFLLE